MLVKFLVHHSPYVAGDIANVPDKLAEKLIEYKKAESYTVPTTKKSKDSEPK